MNILPIEMVGEGSRFKTRQLTVLHSFINYCKEGKLLREKTFADFKVLWLFAKVFSTKFGGMASFGGTSEHFPKLFLSFLLQSFPLYSIYLQFLPCKYPLA